MITTLNDFMESTTLTHATVLEELQKRLTNEIEGVKKKVHPIHNSVFNRSLEQKMMMKWTLETIASNPNITLQELEGLIDYRIESLERELDDAQTREETDRIFDQIRVLDRIIFIVRNAMNKYKTTDYGE